MIELTPLDKKTDKEMKRDLFVMKTISAVTTTAIIVTFIGLFTMAVAWLYQICKPYGIYSVIGATAFLVAAFWVAWEKANITITLNDNNKEEQEDGTV